MKNLKLKVRNGALLRIELESRKMHEITLIKTPSITTPILIFFKKKKIEYRKKLRLRNC